MKKLLALALSLSSVVLVGAALAAAPASAGAWCPTAPANHICPSKYPKGTPFKAELTSGTSVIFKGGVSDECKQSVLEGTLQEGNGILMSSVKFSQCGSLWETIEPGAWYFPWAEGTHSATSGQGGARVKIYNPTLGVTCYYDIPPKGAPFKGVELIGGSPARLRIVTAHIRRAEGSGFFCASEATMSAEWTVTSPSPLYVEKE